MATRKLITQSLGEALMSMDIGETCMSPDNVTKATVVKTCSELKKSGKGLWKTATVSGQQTITRLK